MEIKGKVHCFFEQSGTFKNEFKKLGIPAEDYDIQNNFGETDHVMDLFGEIDRAYDNLTRQDKTRQDKTRQDKTLFDKIDPCQDLIVAFYPCIYFCEKSQMSFYLSMTNYRALKDDEKILKIIEQLKKENEQLKAYESHWKEIEEDAKVIAKENAELKEKLDKIRKYLVYDIFDRFKYLENLLKISQETQEELSKRILEQQKTIGSLIKNWIDRL